VVRKCLTASAADTAALGAYVQRFADAYFRRQPELADNVTAERAALDALNQRWSAHAAAVDTSAGAAAGAGASAGGAATAAFSVENEARLEAAESAARAQREAALGGAGAGAGAAEEQRSPVARARAASVHSFVSTEGAAGGGLEDGDEAAAAAAVLVAERKLAPTVDEHAGAAEAMGEDDSDFLVCTEIRFFAVCTRRSCIGALANHTRQNSEVLLLFRFSV
jgi:hypothetical protein